MKLVILVLLLASCAVGQSVLRGYEPEQLASDLKALKTEEDNCTHNNKDCESFEQDELVAKELHISLGVRGCSQIVAGRVRLDGTNAAGLVRMQCGWDLNLVFTQRTATGWRFLQTLVIPNKYWEATVSFAAVTGDTSQQVLVHKAQYQSGTGVGQQNFVVYKLRGQQLYPVLNVVERAHLTPPWTEGEVAQRSEFTFEPANQPDTFPHFEERQIIEFAGLVIELKREHYWSQADQMFRSSQWYSARRIAPATKKVQTKPLSVR